MPQRPSKGETMVDGPQGKMRITQNGPNAGATVTSKEMGTIKSTMVDGAIHIEASKVSMTKFAEMLNQFVDRPVVDQTGLTGNYQVALEIPMAEMIAMAQKMGMLNGAPPGALQALGGGGDGASDPTGGSVFKAVAGMGLKLEPKKDSIEMIVVDHMEKAPSSN